MKTGSLLVVLALAAIGCPGDRVNDDGTLSGACEAGETYCVDRTMIQTCVEGSWGDPQACEPLEGSGEIPVAIPTYCGESGCQPGG